MPKNLRAERQIESPADRLEAVGAVVGYVAASSSVPAGEIYAALHESTGFSRPSVHLAARIARLSGLMVQNGSKSGFRLTAKGQEWYDTAGAGEEDADA